MEMYMHTLYPGPTNYNSPKNHFQEFNNLQVAFDFIKHEQIRLEGIGPNNLRDHNLKRILGLIWSLIQHYHLSTATDKTHFEKLLLAWLQASLPYCRINNLTTDWNDGCNLSALVDYCGPGLIPDHASLSPDKAKQSILNAMFLAWQHFGVPKIMKADDLAAEKPDTRSVILYLSQFCCPDASGQASIGQKVLLKWIQQQIPDQKITNFTTNWTNGRSLGALTNAVSGGGFPEYEDMDPKDDLQNCRRSIDAAKRLLAIEKSVSAEEFSQQDTNQLIRMTYLTHFRYASPVLDPPPPPPSPPVPPPAPLPVPPTVEETNADACIAIGPGLLSAMVGEESEFFVNCEQGGPGSLQVDIISDTSTVKAVVQENKNQNFAVTFTPTVAEEHTISVTWDGQKVRNSPFKCFVLGPSFPDASKCIVTGPEIPPKMSAPVTFKVDTSNAGHGRLSAVAVGERAGQSSVDVQEMEPNMFHVSFKCPVPDKYNLSMEWGGDAVPRSPFFLNLDTPNPNAVTIVKPPSPSVHAGEPIAIVFNVSQAGRGELTAKCVGTDVGEVKVTVVRNPDSTYDVQFVPPDIDLYTLSIYWNSVHIKRSPFTINLAPPIIENVKVIGPTYSLGGPVELMLQTHGAGKGKVSASCLSLDGNSVPVSITETSHECFLLTFPPPKPDVYTFAVHFGGENVKGSPFYVNTIPPDASKVIVKEPDHVEVDMPAVYQCNTLRAGTGKLSASCKGKSSGVLPVETVEKNPSQYTLSFTPQTPDIYTISISWAGKEVPNSPFQVNLLPPNASMVKVIETHVPDKPGAGEEAWIDLDCSEAGPAVPMGGCKGDRVQNIPVQVEMLRPCIYRAKFEAKEEDNYHFTIYYGHEALPGSPFLFSVTLPEVIETMTASIQSNPPECIVTVPKEGSKVVPITSQQTFTLYVGDPLHLQLNLQTPEQRTGVVYATAKGEKTGQAEIESVQDPNGNFTVTFVPNTPDVYTLEVTFEGVPIPNSPIVVNCIARPADASKCYIFGLKEGDVFDVGKEISFGVNVREAGDGVLSVTGDGPCDGSKQNQLRVLQSQAEPHIYNVTYIPTAAGQHRIYIQWANDTIPGSPLRLQVGEGSDILTYSKNPVEFEITANCQSDSLESYAIHQDTGYRSEVHISQMEDNRFNLSFQATAVGTYLVHVFLDAKEIQGSPYKITYCPEPEPGVPELPLKIHLQAQKTTLYFEKGCYAQFLVSAVDANSGTLGITATGPGKARAKLVDKLDGTYSCTFSPSVPGRYTVNVTWNEQHIPGSPLMLSFKPRNTQAVVGLDLQNETFFIGVPHQFKVDGSDLDRGDFHLKCKPTSAAKVSVSPMSGTRSYQCEIVPLEEGNHEIQAFYKVDHADYIAKQILGSPFIVTFRHRGDASKCIVTSASLVNDIGDCALISVSSEGAGRGKLTSFATKSGSGENVPVTTAKVSKHEYSIELCPDEAGEQLVNILYDGEHIPESPLKVMFRESDENHNLEAHESGNEAMLVNGVTTIPSKPTMVKAYGPGLKDGFVGQEGMFVVATGKAGFGVLDVHARGPKGAYKVKMRQHPENERTVIIRYDPNTAGTYTFNITWSDVHIPGSPFTVTIADQN